MLQGRHDTRNVSAARTSSTIVGQRLRQQREALGWPLERVGVALGLDESAARARISRYELGIHQPPEQTTVDLARVLGVPHAYLHCENDRLAAIILATSQLPAADQDSLLASIHARLADLQSAGRSK